MYRSKGSIRIVGHVRNLSLARVSDLETKGVGSRVDLGHDDN